MLAVWFAALTVGHLDTAPNAGTWAHLVSRSPAAALGAGPCEIAPGGPTMFLPLAVQAGGRPCPLSGVYNADAHTMTLPAHLAGFDACVAAHFRPDPAS